jgi:hypothetical protein
VIGPCPSPSDATITLWTPPKSKEALSKKCAKLRAMVDPTFMGLQSVAAFLRSRRARSPAYTHDNHVIFAGKSQLFFLDCVNPEGLAAASWRHKAQR